MNIEDLKYAVVDPSTGGLVVHPPALGLRVSRPNTAPYHDCYWDVRNLAVLDPKTGALVIGRPVTIAGRRAGLASRIIGRVSRHPSR